MEFNKKKYEYRTKIWWENKLKTLTQKLEQLTKNLINFNGKQGFENITWYIYPMLEFNKKSMIIEPINGGKGVQKHNQEVGMT